MLNNKRKRSISNDLYYSTQGGGGSGTPPTCLESPDTLNQVCALNTGVTTVTPISNTVTVDDGASNTNVITDVPLKTTQVITDVIAGFNNTDTIELGPQKNEWKLDFVLTGQQTKIEQQLAALSTQVTTSGSNELSRVQLTNDGAGNPVARTDVQITGGATNSSVMTPTSTIETLTNGVNITTDTHTPGTHVLNIAGAASNYSKSEASNFITKNMTESPDSNIKVVAPYLETTTITNGSDTITVLDQATLSRTTVQQGTASNIASQTKAVTSNIITNGTTSITLSENLTTPAAPFSSRVIDDGTNDSLIYQQQDEIRLVTDTASNVTYNELISNVTGTTATTTINAVDSTTTANTASVTVDSTPRVKLSADDNTNMNDITITSTDITCSTEKFETNPDSNVGWGVITRSGNLTTTNTTLNMFPASEADRARWIEGKIVRKDPRPGTNTNGPEYSCIETFSGLIQGHTGGDITLTMSAAIENRQNEVVMLDAASVCGAVYGNDGVVDIVVEPLLKSAATIPNTNYVVSIKYTYL